MHRGVLEKCTQTRLAARELELVATRAGAHRAGSVDSPGEQSWKERNRDVYEWNLHIERTHSNTLGASPALR